MSIAELIMTGTNRASDSTAWVGDSLAKLGQNVGQALAQREQQKQAQETLPILQQTMQESMALAQSGKSGEAYSKMLGAINPQMMNNPQMLPFIKLGFDAIDKSANDFLYSQKVAQGTSMTPADLLALQILNQQAGVVGVGGAGGAGGGVGAGVAQGAGTQDVPAQIVQGVELVQAPGMEDIDTTQGISAVRNNQFSVPVQGKDNKTYYAQPIEGNLPVDGGTNQIDNPAPWTPPTAKAQQQPTPEQVQAAAFAQQNQQIADTQGVGAAWYNEAVDPKSPKLKELSQSHEPLDFKGVEKFNVGTIYFPKEQDINKEIKITTKGNNFNFSVDRNKVNTELEKQRRALKTNITNAIEKIKSKEMKDLFDDYGSIENFPFPSLSKPKVIIFPRKEKDKDGRVKIVSLPITGKPDEEGVIQNMGMGDAFELLKNLPGTAKTIGVVVARSGEMPPVGANQQGQTSANPKVLNAIAQAQKELPNASKDQILARAREIAGVK